MQVCFRSGLNPVKDVEHWRKSARSLWPKKSKLQIYKKI